MDARDQLTIKNSKRNIYWVKLLSLSTDNGFFLRANMSRTAYFYKRHNTQERHTEEWLDFLLV